MTPQTQEPWVDSKVIAQHTGFSVPTVRRMAEKGAIPAHLSKNGKRAFWRFKLSQVDAVMQAAITSPVVSSKAGTA
jgi:predicted DNA-binding transcriptional regulator AlpA